MSQAEHTTTTTSLHGWIRELFDYRTLIYFFTWRYLKVRYKQTAIGIVWVVIQPLFLTAIVSLFIFRGLKIDFGYEDVALILPVFVGLALWSYFDKTVNTMGNSLVSNRNIMTKIYFPKLIPPIASLISGLVDLAFALLLLVVISVITGSSISLLAPIFITLGLLLMLVATAGLGLLFAALNVEYRDISQVMPFFFRIGIFATPVLYPVTFLPPEFREFLFANPMTGAIELFRNGLFDPSLIDWYGIVISTVAAVAFFVIGLIVFKRKEPNMIDVI